MKNDPMTTILNFVLAILVIAAMGLGWLATRRANNLQNAQQGAQLFQAQLALQEAKFQSLVNDVSAYNQQAKSPEITRMLQTLVSQPAAK